MSENQEDEELRNLKREVAKLKLEANLRKSLADQLAAQKKIADEAKVEVEKKSKEVMLTGNLRDHAIDEIADILIYTIAFCNENNIDIKNAVDRKMKKNRIKYPVKKFKGRF